MVFVVDIYKSYYNCDSDTIYLFCALPLYQYTATAGVSSEATFSCAEIKEEYKKLGIALEPLSEDVPHEEIKKKITYIYPYKDWDLWKKEISITIRNITYTYRNCWFTRDDPLQNNRLITWDSMQTLYPTFQVMKIIVSSSQGNYTVYCGKLQKKDLENRRIQTTEKKRDDHPMLDLSLFDQLPAGEINIEYVYKWIPPWFVHNGKYIININNIQNLSDYILNNDNQINEFNRTIQTMNMYNLCSMDDDSSQSKETEISYYCDCDDREVDREPWENWVLEKCIKHNDVISIMHDREHWVNSSIFKNEETMTYFNNHKVTEVTNELSILIKESWNVLNKKFSLVDIKQKREKGYVIKCIFKGIVPPTTLTFVEKNFKVTKVDIVIPDDYIRSISDKFRAVPSTTKIDHYRGFTENVVKVLGDKNKHGTENNWFNPYHVYISELRNLLTNKYKIDLPTDITRHWQPNQGNIPILISDDCFKKWGKLSLLQWKLPPIEESDVKSCAVVKFDRSYFVCATSWCFQCQRPFYFVENFKKARFPLHEGYTDEQGRMFQMHEREVRFEKIDYGNRKVELCLCPTSTDDSPHYLMRSMTENYKFNNKPVYGYIFTQHLENKHCFLNYSMVDNKSYLIPKNYIKYKYHTTKEDLQRCSPRERRYYKDNKFPTEEEGDKTMTHYIRGLYLDSKNGVVMELGGKQFTTTCYVVTKNSTLLQIYNGLIKLIDRTSPLDFMNKSYLFYFDLLYKCLNETPSKDLFEKELKNELSHIKIGKHVKLEKVEDGISESVETDDKESSPVPNKPPAIAPAKEPAKASDAPPAKPPPAKASAKASDAPPAKTPDVPSAKASDAPPAKASDAPPAKPPAKASDAPPAKASAEPPATAPAKEPPATAPDAKPKKKSTNSKGGIRGPSPVIVKDEDHRTEIIMNSLKLICDLITMQYDNMFFYLYRSTDELGKCPNGNPTTSHLVPVFATENYYPFYKKLHSRCPQCTYEFDNTHKIHTRVTIKCENTNCPNKTKNNVDICIIIYEETSQYIKLYFVKDLTKDNINIFWESWSKSCLQRFTVNPEPNQQFDLRKLINQRTVTPNAPAKIIMRKKTPVYPEILYFYDSKSYNMMFVYFVKIEGLLYLEINPEQYLDKLPLDNIKKLSDMYKERNFKVSEFLETYNQKDCNDTYDIYLQESIFKRAFASDFNDSDLYMHFDTMLHKKMTNPDCTDIELIDLLVSRSKSTRVINMKKVDDLIGMVSQQYERIKGNALMKTFTEKLKLKDVFEKSSFQRITDSNTPITPSFFKRMSVFYNKSNRFDHWWVSFFSTAFEIIEDGNEDPENVCVIEIDPFTRKATVGKIQDTDGEVHIYFKIVYPSGSKMSIRRDTENRVWNKNQLSSFFNSWYEIHKQT